MSHDCIQRSPCSCAVFGLLMCVIAGWEANAEVLIHSHFDADTAHADFTVGHSGAAPVSDDYELAITAKSRWGRALHLMDSRANCTFDTGKNFNPERGTVSLWFRIEEHESGMYHPLFGWYRPPHEPGAKKRLSALEVYLHNSVLTLGLYTPEYASQSKPTAIEVGKWHHLEVNWDCARGAGHCVYNVFVDGQSLIRVIEAGALTDGAGAKLHLGVWDYAFSHFLHGQIDELRITDQVEHSDTFDPPTGPYATPQTIEYARETHGVAKYRLQKLRSDLNKLNSFSGTEGVGTTATYIRETRADADRVEVMLTTLESALKSTHGEAKTLCRSVDEAADRLSVIRLPLHRIMVEAAALAEEEDRRSLLFKDVNDKLAGDVVMLSGRQLFIDDHIIGRLDGIQRTLNPAVTEVAEMPVAAEDTTLNVTAGAFFYDGKRKQFSLWYVYDSGKPEKQRLFFATSKDGLKWNKPDRRPPLTARTQSGLYECEFHKFRRVNTRTKTGGYVAAAPDLDRFVAISVEKSGVLTTRPFIAIGDTLLLNANAEGGSIRVEAIDALGRVIRGFSQEDCIAVDTDKIDHVVLWNGETNCHPLQARPIRLRFHLENAQLYSFEFKIRHNHFVPMSYSQ